MRAPVAILTYNRIDTTAETIRRLEANLLADETDVYVYCDGGNDAKSWDEVRALRAFLHTLHPRFKSFHIIEREENVYINRNLQLALDELFECYGCAIVVEDDIATSPCFLTYMNEALEHYAAVKRVMAVCGFTNLNVPQKGDVYLTRYFAGWGWATWADRWQEHYHLLRTKQEALSLLTEQQRRDIEYGGEFRCLHHLDMGKIDWDLSWLIAIRHADGLCLAPTQTLVRNTGINGGLHYRNMSLFGHYEFDREPINRHLNVVLPVIEADREVEDVLNPRALKDHGFRYNLFGKVVRKIYKILIKRHA